MNILFNALIQDEWNRFEGFKLISNLLYIWNIGLCAPYRIHGNIRLSGAVSAEYLFIYNTDYSIPAYLDIRMSCYSVIRFLNIEHLEEAYITLYLQCSN